jgi:hypothetical protein
MWNAPQVWRLERVRENEERAKKQRLAAPPAAAAVQTLIVFFKRRRRSQPKISLKKAGCDSDAATTDRHTPRPSVSKRLRIFFRRASR